MSKRIADLPGWQVLTTVGLILVGGYIVGSVALEGCRNEAPQLQQDRREDGRKQAEKNLIEWEKRFGKDKEIKLVSH